MRRAGRILFTILSSVSLLLCVATCVLWVRSYWRADVVSFEGWENADGWHRNAYFGSMGGSVGSEWSLRQDEGKHSQRDGEWTYGSRPIATSRNSLRQSLTAFVYKADVLKNTPVTWGVLPIPQSVTYQHALWFPHWTVALAASIAPAAWLFRRHRAGKRLRDGFCRVCGYDLRESPERCPECGTAKPAAV